MDWGSPIATILVRIIRAARISAAVGDWTPWLESHRFACPSLDTLADWFKGWHQRIRDTGHELWVIETPDNLIRWGISRKQMAVPYSAMVKVRLVGISEHAGLLV